MGNGGVEHICGTVKYIQPRGSSLQFRGFFTQEDLWSALSSRFDPEDFDEGKRRSTSEMFRLIVQL